ncbi:hypothetical protein ACFOU2_13220 [Bacillus songklensis]|uniref:Uncharacterized protein n=1 Tax=Bacillus songklensis TaxID=1069116 RepID=A0ABV8B3C7_9BACI
MKKGFHVANLSAAEKEKLQRFEEEFGKVLIAWEKDELDKPANTKM